MVAALYALVVFSVGTAPATDGQGNRLPSAEQTWQDFQTRTQAEVRRMGGMPLAVRQTPTKEVWHGRADLDRDGRKESVEVAFDKEKFEDRTYLTGRYLATVAGVSRGKRYRLASGGRSSQESPVSVFVIDLDRRDRFRELVIQGHGPSDHTGYEVLRLRSRGVRKLSKVGDISERFRIRGGGLIDVTSFGGSWWETVRCRVGDRPFLTRVSRIARVDNGHTVYRVVRKSLSIRTVAHEEVGSLRFVGRPRTYGVGSKVLIDKVHQGKATLYGHDAVHVQILKPRVVRGKRVDAPVDQGWTDVAALERCMDLPHPG